MIINPHAIYKVIEFDGGIGLINATTKSRDPGAVELVWGALDQCMLYLGRYVEERKVHNMIGAHEIASREGRYVFLWRPTR